jgi:hypothetical protein
MTYFPKKVFYTYTFEIEKCDRYNDYTFTKIKTEKLTDTMLVAR